MQLKLYSQTTADKTAVLYAATALGVSQAPHGLYHLQGSMQALSDRLVQSLQRDRGELHMRQTAEAIESKNGEPLRVKISNYKGESWIEAADHVVANVTVPKFGAPSPR